MVLVSFVRFTHNLLPKTCTKIIVRKCHSVFDIKDIVHQVKPHHFTLNHVTKDEHDMAIDIIKRHFLTQHVLVQARKMDLTNDTALDQYLCNLLKQGNSMYAKAEDGTVAGVCVNFATSPVDPRNLRNYAFYRQDPNTKDFLYFTAKLQESPNLWDLYKQPKVYEVKMIAVLPEYRRQGLATTLVEKSKELANGQGYKVVRMDCINPYDYKIAERCMLHCIVKFPLHKIRGPNAPFIKQQSEFNRCVRVYVHLFAHGLEMDRERLRVKAAELESLIE